MQTPLPSSEVQAVRLCLGCDIASASTSQPIGSSVGRWNVMAKKLEERKSSSSRLNGIKRPSCHLKESLERMQAFAERKENFVAAIQAK